MKILTIRSDKPQAEIGLFEGEKQLDYEVWQADKELSLTILSKIKELLSRNSLDFEDLGGIVGFKGPGSFTGLRIGLTVANTLAYGLKIPIVGSNKEAWIQDGILKLDKNQNEKVVLPGYGREPHITKAKK
ncbi:MAG TPA: tRNA (adenosine(37)-N6)-threonylcarbamoyltransferase complex dimerization subunit type 1 TsaB [Candidatus Saccharimonadales bacterium]|jgi:tRNA threonylcarbamoyladenosine biosynthesis protein TsaB